MPQYTIDISEAAVTTLIQDHVAPYNGNMGTELTLLQWFHLHIKDLCIQKRLAGEIEVLRKAVEQKQQTGLQAAVKTKMDELRAEY